MKLSLYKALFQVFEELDVHGYKVAANRKLTYRKIGKVVFEDRDKREKELDLVIMCDVPDDASEGLFVTFTDGSSAVALTEKCFINKTYIRLIAIVAHEIGHFLTGQEVLKDNYLNIKKHKQKRLAKLYHNSGEDIKRLKQYYRSQLSSLLLGGVLTKEFEADIKALDYVPLDALTALHAEDLKHANPFVRLEKINRINLLNEVFADETEDRTFLKLELVLPKLKSVKVTDKIS
ncbi:hypothetical protein [Flavobacterium sp.]|jgi:hypothetical protein|uniref:hypothetical protein n=1 Tax=Flavobacterium sp. TaxID=239 RepID=UPI0037BEB358